LDKAKLNLRQIALFGMLGALTFGAKVAMSGLPNIEPVSLFVMLFAVVFGWKCLYPIYLYVLMEVMLYGINFWNINYLYVWVVLAVAAIAMRRLKNPLWWALLSGLFGLAFGLLCSPVYMAVGASISYGIRWWLAGIPFDVTHAIGNFVIALVLFVPLRKLLSRLYGKIQ
jgi:energy-coupling factor transport system substrate-specific component